MFPGVVAVCDAETIKIDVIHSKKIVVKKETVRAAILVGNDTATHTTVANTIG